MLLSTRPWKINPGQSRFSKVSAPVWSSVHKILSTKSRLKRNKSLARMVMAVPE